MCTELLIVRSSRGVLPGGGGGGLDGGEGGGGDSPVLASVLNSPALQGSLLLLGNLSARVNITLNVTYCLNLRVLVIC